MVKEFLRFLERIADLHEAGMAALNHAVLNDVEQDSWQALACFLYGFAYERQGRSPAYAPLARDTILTLKDKDASWEEAGLAQRAWQLYEELASQLYGKQPEELNPKLNPMCPEGTSYKTKKGGMKVTTQPSAIEFVKKYLPDFDYNIVHWAEEELKAEAVQRSHMLLKSINGVADKIASLFLRDVALAYGITPSQSRELLQPIDVWVGRFVHHWAKDKDKDNAECAAWVVEKSREAGVSPEKVNAGMWYFGSQIAGNERILLSLLEDVASMEQKTEEYVNRMAAQVAAWQRLAR